MSIRLQARGLFRGGARAAVLELASPSSLMGILYCPLPYKAKEARRDAGLLSLVFHVFASDPERDHSGAQRTDGHDGDQYGHNQHFHGVLLS